MGGQNRIKIDIGGLSYSIMSSEKPDYVLELATEINKLVNELMLKGPTMSLNNALVICALNYIDLYKKSEANSDNLRIQVKDYLEDAARSRIEMDEMRRENDKLRRELNAGGKNLAVK